MAPSLLQNVCQLSWRVVLQNP